MRQCRFYTNWQNRPAHTRQLLKGESAIARIQVLDKRVAELIAAGEVVERPSSVVKELVENSIDAGASCITVEIKNGGVSYIRITDDGSGIERADVPVAFLRHATSKLRKESDLDSIGTLGFRGEALASVSAVARVELLTRTAEEMAGTRYLIEGGEEKLLEDAACPQGTTIIVRDLFYNVPARMKFLKKTSQRRILLRRWWTASPFPIPKSPSG